MPIRIFDQTVGQTAGLSIPTTGKGAITNDGLEAYAQVTVTASGQPVIGDAAGEGNVVALTGATVTDGTISFAANSQSVVIDTYGFGGAALTVLGFGTATIQVQWGNISDSTFVAGEVTNINTGTTASTITASGQYTVSSGGRYMRIVTTAFTSGPITVTPVLLTGGVSAGGGGGGGTISGNVGILNDADVQINPATEETLDSVLTALNTPAAELPPTPLLAATDLTRAFDDGSTVGEESLVGATVGQTTKVYIVDVSSAGAGYIELRDGSAGTVLFRADFTGAAARVYDLNERPWAKTSANTALYWYRSAAVAMTVQIWYEKSA